MSENNINIARINIFNETDIEIPRNISEILKFGFDNAIGSTPKPVAMRTHFDTFCNFQFFYAN